MGNCDSLSSWYGLETFCDGGRGGKAWLTDALFPRWHAFSAQRSRVITSGLLGVQFISAVAELSFGCCGSGDKCCCDCDCPDPS